MNFINGFLLFLITPFLMQESYSQTNRFNDIKKKIFFNIDITNPSLNVDSFSTIKELRHKDEVVCQKSLHTSIMANGDTSAEICTHYFLFSKDPLFHQEIESGVIMLKVLSTRSAETVRNVSWSASFESEKQARDYLMKLTNLFKSEGMFHKEEKDDNSGRYIYIFASEQLSKDRRDEVTIVFQRSTGKTGFEIRLMPSLDR